MKLSCVALIFSLIVLASATAAAQSSSGGQELAPGSPALVTSEELLQMLQSGKDKPLVLNIGPSLLFMQAHIPGAEYIGAAAERQGLERLRARVKPLPRNTSIVLYCGCCPWSHCPNVHPAYNQLHAMGFSNLKVLYIANNFGSDWVDKGYPTIKGQ
jgi:hypothetical protein